MCKAADAKYAVLDYFVDDGVIVSDAYSAFDVMSWKHIIDLLLYLIDHFYMSPVNTLSVLPDRTEDPTEMDRLFSKIRESVPELRFDLHQHIEDEMLKVGKDTLSPKSGFNKLGDKFLDFWFFDNGFFWSGKNDFRDRLLYDLNLSLTYKIAFLIAGKVFGVSLSLYDDVVEELEEMGDDTTITFLRFVA